MGKHTTLIWIVFVVVALAAAFAIGRYMTTDTDSDISRVDLQDTEVNLVEEVNQDIPAGYLYTDPSEELPDPQPEVEGNNDGSVFETSFATITFNKEETKDVECANEATGDEVEVVEYYHSYVEDAVGGGSSRMAVRCGDEYIVYEYLSHTGPMWAGPFQLEQ